MKKNKIAVVFGTRPEAIKLAPVILALKNDSRFECRVIVTGQHREMLDRVLDVFKIVPDHDLNLMKADQALSCFTARAIESLDQVYKVEAPELVFVQGDTSTVFCAALAAFYHHIPIGHIEAGLRTHNLYAPWPEEANRTLTTRLASLHFAPTTNARDNLLNEGIQSKSIIVTGNTIIDALLIALERIRKDPPEIPGLPKEVLERGKDGSLVLITGHRRENFGIGFANICQAISQLAERFPRVIFVYPVHLNPNVQKPVYELLSNHENVHLIDPLDYLPFIALMDYSTLILTDSGGIQEEAPSLGKPVLVMRETTERCEALDSGRVKLVGTDPRTIVESSTAILSNKNSHRIEINVTNPYGDGKGKQDHFI